jgi:hypothetical protein
MRRRGIDSPSLLHAEGKTSHLLKGREKRWGEEVASAPRGKGRQGEDRRGARRCGSVTEPVGEAAALDSRKRRVALGVALRLGKQRHMHGALLCKSGKDALLEWGKEES